MHFPVILLVSAAFLFYERQELADAMEVLRANPDMPVFRHLADVAQILRTDEIIVKYQNNSADVRVVGAVRLVIDSFGDECEIVLFQVVNVISDQIGCLPALQKIQLMVVVKVDHRHFGSNRIYLMFKEINLVRMENCHLCSNPSGGRPENLISSQY